MADKQKFLGSYMVFNHAATLHKRGKSAEADAVLSRAEAELASMVEATEPAASERIKPTSHRVDGNGAVVVGNWF